MMPGTTRHEEVIMRAQAGDELTIKGVHRGGTVIQHHPAGSTD
jgi:hypothetical protein